MSLPPSTADQGSGWLSSLPTGPRGQALALAMLGVAIAFVWLLAGQPLVDLYAEQGARLAGRQTLAARMETRLAEVGADAGGTQAPTAIDSYPSGLVEAESDALGAALLQDLVTAAATEAGLALSSVETLPAEDAGSLRKLGLRLNLEGPYPALVRMIGSLRQGSVALILDDLEIHAGSAGDMGTDKQDAADAEQGVRAGFTVHSFRSTAPASVPPAQGDAS